MWTFTKSFIFINITEQLDAEMSSVFPVITYCSGVLFDQCGDIGHPAPQHNETIGSIA
jgi:hypothetical protein